MKAWNLRSLLVIGQLSACAHLRGPHSMAGHPTTQNSTTHKTRPTRPVAEVAFSSMGTVWTINLGATDKTVDISGLQDALMREALEVERTFSDWAEDSELRRLERDGLTKWHQPSVRFYRGLELAQQAYLRSESAFDITVGAVLWKKLRAPVGLDKLVLAGGRFKFKADPQRLSFGGFIKGAAAGSLAEKLRQAGLKNFRVNAGGGNLVVAGDNYGEAWADLDGQPLSTKVLFISRSNSSQGASQHTIDPEHPSRRLERSSQVICAADGPDWFTGSGLADALSTALIVRPDLDDLPQNCQTKVRQRQN